MKRFVRKLSLALGVLSVVAVCTMFLTAANTDRKLNFQEKVLTNRPNQFLLCPANFCGDTPHLTAPEINLTVEQLAEAWEKLVQRVGNLEALPTHSVLRRTYIARSKLLRYPDRVTVEFIPRGAASSSLVIYSQSKYGYSDAGVNEKRVRAFLNELVASVKRVN